MTLDLTILILSLCNLAMYAVGYIINKKRVEKAQRISKRNNEVYKFRMFVLENMYDKYNQLPTYEEMVYDGNPLVLESYFKEVLN